MKYIYLDINPDTLDSGRPLSFGDEIELTKQTRSDNQRLVDSGKIVEFKENQNPQEGN